jgi:TPR repeat protein
MNPRILIIIAAGFVAVVGGRVLLQNNSQSETQPVAQTISAISNAPVDIAALKAKAEAGDAAAQTSLGWAYQKGNSTKPDMKEAVKWFQKAADQNYPDGLAALGEMMQAGQGISVDPTNAARLYRLAAEKGSVSGQYNLAYMYEQGIGMDKNEVEAAKWYEQAASGGDPIAQYDIGQRYMLGIGVATNRVQACKWLTFASAQNQMDSIALLKKLKSQMSSDELSQADRLSKENPPHLSVHDARQ